MVGGADRARRRRNGGEAGDVRGARTARAAPAGGEVPWTRIPADHLRPRVHATGEPRAAAVAGVAGEAVARAAGVRARYRGARAVRSGRATPARARVRVWGAGAGERAGGSKVVGGGGAELATRQML